jgi:hypothetical protein
MNWYVFGFIMLYITLVIGVIIPFIPLKGQNWLYRGFQTWGIPSRHEMVVAILEMLPGFEEPHIYGESEVIHDGWWMTTRGTMLYYSYRSWIVIIWELAIPMKTKHVFLDFPEFFRDNLLTGHPKFRRILPGASIPRGTSCSWGWKGRNWEGGKGTSYPLGNSQPWNKVMAQRSLYLFLNMVEFSMTMSN